MFFPDCYLHLPMFQIWNIDWCLIFGHLSDFFRAKDVNCPNRETTNLEKNDIVIASEVTTEAK